MKNIKKKVFSVLSAVSFMGMCSVGALPHYNGRGIVTSISEGATSKENLFAELKDAYKHYLDVLEYEECLDYNIECGKLIQLLLADREYRNRNLSTTDSIRRENRRENKVDLISMSRDIFDSETIRNLMNARYDDEIYALCCYNYIINGGIGTSHVWAHYFSKLLSDKNIENYVLNIGDEYGLCHIVAYKLEGRWYGITCYNLYRLIDGEEISDLSTCLRNLSKEYFDIIVDVDTRYCKYFRNLDISTFTKEEKNSYIKEGICVEIPRELINSGNWDSITDRLMEKITQCHNPEYLKRIHPVYSMIYNLLND